MINRCDDCIHAKLCIYKQKYQKKYKTIKNNLICREPFYIELNCKNYRYDLQPCMYSLTTPQTEGDEK